MGARTWTHVQPEVQLRHASQVAILLSRCIPGSAQNPAARGQLRHLKVSQALPALQQLYRICGFAMMSNLEQVVAVPLC
eukprot:12225324-Alexandrium_andersonii.AAC.1